ncbi:MAG: HepT-like ribonuclease domain-containing protein, partial [Mycobacteriales bacterium]
MEAIDRISHWLGGIDEDGWDSDDMLRAAVLQQLTTIGEASRSVSNQLRERYPDVPWRRIADFRNVAVHQYFAIEWSLVWRLVRRSSADFTTPDHKSDQDRVSGQWFAVRRTLTQGDLDPNYSEAGRQTSLGPEPTATRSATTSTRSG